MPESLPTTPEPNTRKLLFVGLVSAVIFVVIAFFVFMSSGSKTVAGK